jgi:DNA-3-methyladenine glycosylase I
MPREMQAPKQITPKRLGDYLEVITKAAFQSGISWAVVEAKWPGITTAFAGWDAGRVADFSPDDIDRIATDPSVIRNRRKIEATVWNAQVLVGLERQYGSFQKYLLSQPEFVPLVKDLRKRFKFLGDMGAFYFLYVVQHPVPPYLEACRQLGMKPIEGIGGNH